MAVIVLPGREQEQNRRMQMALGMLGEADRIKEERLAPEQKIQERKNALFERAADALVEGDVAGYMRMMEMKRQLDEPDPKSFEKTLETTEQMEAQKRQSEMRAEIEKKGRIAAAQAQGTHYGQMGAEEEYGPTYDQVTRRMNQEKQDQRARKIQQYVNLFDMSLEEAVKTVDGVYETLELDGRFYLADPNTGRQVRQIKIGPGYDQEGEMRPPTEAELRRMRTAAEAATQLDVEDEKKAKVARAEIAAKEAAGEPVTKEDYERVLGPFNRLAYGVHKMFSWAVPWTTIFEDHAASDHAIKSFNKSLLSDFMVSDKGVAWEQKAILEDLLLTPEVLADWRSAGRRIINLYNHADSMIRNLEKYKRERGYDLTGSERKEINKDLMKSKMLLEKLKSMRDAAMEQKSGIDVGPSRAEIKEMDPMALKGFLAKDVWGTLSREQQRWLLERSKELSR